jgi:hypothetical protein
MDTKYQGPRLAARFILAVSIGLCASACVAPRTESNAGNAANHAAAKSDPVEAVSDALGERLRLMVSPSHPAAASRDNFPIAPANQSE